VGNRVRFPLEAIEAVAETVGAERTAVRISPWSTFQGKKGWSRGSCRALIYFIDMGMKDPLPTFTTLIERIRDNHPNLAYIHVIEARVNGNIFMTLTDENRAHSNEMLRKIWGDRPYVAAGGMGRPTAIDAVEKYGGLVAFGRHFIASVSCLFDLPRVNF
jgi:NADPH2 dehydrogenase